MYLKNGQTRGHTRGHISDVSTQDGDSVGEPESPTRDKAPTNSLTTLDRVDHAKPTQSDCMSVDYSPYTVDDPYERAGATPVPPRGSNQWEDQSG